MSQQSERNKTKRNGAQQQRVFPQPPAYPINQYANRAANWQIGATKGVCNILLDIDASDHQTRLVTTTICLLLLLLLFYWSVHFWQFFARVFSLAAQFKPRTRPEQSRAQKAARIHETRNAANWSDREPTTYPKLTFVVSPSSSQSVSVSRSLCKRMCVCVSAALPAERRFIKIRFSFCALIQFVPCCRVEVAGDANA